MPIYEYECSKCGHFEIVQKASEKPLKCDPDCTRKGCPKDAKRLISATAFHLKGTGWYKTDYAKSGSAGSSSKNGGKKPAVSKESGESSGSASSSGSDSSSSSSSGDSGDSSGKKAASCSKGCGCH